MLLLFCSNCGKYLSDEAKFCPVCGKLTNIKEVKKTLQFKCKNCNGVMNIDDEREILLCPYCGSREAVVESDNVKIARIRNRTYKEVEFKKMEREIEIEKKREEKNMAEAFSKSKLSTTALVFAILCGIIALGAFNSSHILRGIIALVQTMLFIASLLIGKHIIKVENHNLSTISAVIGFLLIIPFFLIN